MPSISPTASLKSTDSSFSSCSEVSEERNFYDRSYVEDSSTDSSQEDAISLSNGHIDENLALKLNVFHQTDNLVKVNSFETIRDVENASLPNGEEDADFWLPPMPEDEDDDVIGSVASYDDDDEDDECGDWAKPSSFSGSREGGGSYKFKEEKINAMNGIRNGKFMGLVSQLVKSVGVDPSGNYGENWVDIVTSLSWEAAAFVKPNEGKAMDPDGYVKVKCIATGLRTQSQVIKGLVFKKHAAHKHMATKYKNPRLLLIYGSLDLSSDGLSSFNSMQQQEKNNLKTIVEMIENCHPNVILVEKSVSRDIQESILAKGMTLVFDMKLHRLERVARCIGLPILAAELATGQKLRQCDSFHIERFVEEHDGSNEGGKKPSKTLMFLKGCPSRHGCTIVLMGANSDELKRIKVIIRCAVVMAYHLMLETSFLLDQSAMFSTVSPSDLPFSNKKLMNKLNMCNSDEETNMSLTLDISSIPNGFHQNGSDSSFQSCNHATFPGLSLSTSIQKVMDESFPLFSDKSNDRSIEENMEMQYQPEFSDCYEDRVFSKDEIGAVLDSESILVLMSSRNASRGTICEQSRFSHIKFYRSFDVPLGKFLHDNLLNQKLLCKSCGETPEVHYFYYAHQDKQLTVQVRHLPATKSLPGETEGKLWMWSRCGQCKHGSSKPTKRVLISTAARGLSFGKFLELGFSNLSSFNTPSSCGHSLHKDFLYFFGLGPMVAMFKYSPIVTYSVSLPPDKMEFNVSIKSEFLKKDFDDVYLQGISMFLDIEKSLKEIETRYVGVTLNIQGSSKEFSDIMLMLKHEKSQFEVDIQNAVEDETEDAAACRLLSLNRIRLELLLESCIWDRRLHALLSSDLKVINDSPVEEIHINGQVEGSLGHNSWPTSVVTNDISGLTNNQWNDNGLSTDEFLVGPSPEDQKGWIWAPFPDIHREYMEDLQRGYLPKIESFNSYTAESTPQKLINDEGSRMHIPLNDYIVSDYEDELSSIIACALTLLKDLPIAYEDLAEDVRKERGLDSSQSMIRVFSFTTSHWSSFGSSDSDSSHSTTTTLDDSNSSFDGLDLLESSVSYSASHPEVSMGLGKFPAKRKYSVLCLYASQFRQLRNRCCPSEVDYIASLSRCKNWDAKGGKSGSFFAKTLDDRYIIKEIKRTEFDSFMKFATNYFEYMNQCYELGNQTCLAKILGIYQVIIRATRNGKETRHDLVVMENLSFGRDIARQYDLKGALHARFTSGGDDSGEVLLDQNFVNDMNVSPLYVGRRSKRNLQRAVYNDTNFLNSINVMDYSLLVGVDTLRHELACGIIDYLRQYTWDKQLENWVKSSLVVPKNQLPTIISPRDYKKRFRKFISTHFLSVPDHWCSQTSPPFEQHKKSQKRGNQDHDSSHTSQKQWKREPAAT